MDRHRIPYNIKLTNTDWFNEGCITEIPDYEKVTTFKELEILLNERNK